MKNIKIYIPILFLLHSMSWAQNGADVEDEMLQLMKQQQEMMKKLFDSDDVFNQRVDSIFERLRQNGAFGNLGGDQLNLTNRSLKTKWLEDEKSRTLVIFIADKDDEVNVDIAEGSVTLSGNKSMVNRQGQKIYQGQKFSFSYQIAIPSDVLETTANMKSVDGNIHIVFNKKTLKKAPTKKFKGDGEI